jgi:hypothetical protein
MSEKLKPGVYLVEGGSKTLLRDLSAEECAEFNKMVEDSKKLKHEYHNNHAVCPVCGSGTSTTFAGYIMHPDHPETFRDKNECRCKCGWVGTVHDRVARKVGHA